MDAGLQERIGVLPSQHLHRSICIAGVEFERAALLNPFAVPERALRFVLVVSCSLPTRLWQLEHLALLVQRYLPIVLGLLGVKECDGANHLAWRHAA